MIKTIRRYFNVRRAVDVTECVLNELSHGKMAGSRGIVLSSLSAIHRTVLGSSTLGNISPSGVLCQVRQYAARRGTREKAKKKKVKKEVKKLTVADKIRQSKKLAVAKPYVMVHQEHFLTEPTDDVYCMKYFKKPVYQFQEAIQFHRETMHPTIFNAPNSIVSLFASLNFEGVKKTKPVETFHKMVPVTHKFNHGEERKILVFCKTDEQIAEALAEGASLAGGADIVKLIVSGEILVSNYDTVLAHPSIMPEILTIRGLLKRKHPSLKAGTMSPNLKTLIHNQLHGIKYTAKAFDEYPTYGETTIPIGKLDMDIKHLEDNLKDAITSIMSAKPKRPGSFITKLQIRCPPSIESFNIDHTVYIKEEEAPKIKGKATDAAEEESDDEEENSAVPISN